MAAAADPAPMVTSQLTTDTFRTRYLAASRPVVVRGAGLRWPRPLPWDIGDLLALFGTSRVPVYDSLFSLLRIGTFGQYVAEFFGGAGAGAAVPYLRWFTRQSEHPLPWADAAFEQIADWWEVPGWYPRTGHLLPPDDGADLRRRTLPAKGLFVCAAGGRTRLHVDPWGSSAILIQVTGFKTVAMWATGDGRFDAAPGSLPDAPIAELAAGGRPDLLETLESGDLIFIPAGWAHTAEALTDSVSVTWNFVHEACRDRFDEFLAATAADDTIAFFTGQLPPVARPRRRPPAEPSAPPSTGTTTRAC